MASNRGTTELESVQRKVPISGTQLGPSLTCIASGRRSVSGGFVSFRFSSKSLRFLPMTVLLFLQFS